MKNYFHHFQLCTIVQAHFNHFQVTTLNSHVQGAGFPTIHKVDVRLSVISMFFTFRGKQNSREQTLKINKRN